MWKKRNKTRQIKLILSNSLISPYILHTLEKNPLDQSHPLTRHRFTTTLSVFSQFSIIYSFEILDLPFNLASRFLHPYAWFNPHFSFLFPSPTLSPLLVSLPSTFNPCRDPSFPPSRQPFSALYNLLKDSSLIFHHPSTSSAPPFTWRPFLRISTLWNTTNNVSPTRHRVHVSTHPKFRVIYLHLGLHLEKRCRVYS